MKIHAVGIAALLSVSISAAPQAHNASLLQKAHQAYTVAQSIETELNEKPQAERMRADYLKVISAYERVYLITPHTGYADNSLMTIARLYEEIGADADAIKTLKFLIREYPASPFKDSAEKDVARLSGIKLQRTVAVDNVRFWEAPNSVRIIVDLGGEIRFNQGDAKSPDRVFVDISPAKLNSILQGKQWQVKSGLLQQIRVGQYDNSTVRIVLDIGHIGRVSSFTLRDPDRLVIDVFGKEAPAQLASVSTGSATSLPIAVALPSPTVSTTSPKKPADVDLKPITPAKASNSGTRSLVRSLGLKLSRVVLDAGHGGHDTGTLGRGGYTEKELVLDVARRLKDLIESELGAEVVMTRNDDS